MRFRYFVALVICLPTSAWAQADIINACYIECANSTSSTPELKGCLEKASEQADRKLNEAYKAMQGAVRAQAKAMGQAPDAQLAALTAAQKQWIAYRDANCEFEDGLAFGGTATGGNYMACLCALSLARVDDFSRIRTQVIGE